MAILPTGDEDAEASKVTVAPLIVGVNRAVGAWSGVMAPIESLCASGISRIVEEPVIRSMNATDCPPKSGMYAVFPSGVIPKNVGNAI